MTTPILPNFRGRCSGLPVGQEVACHSGAVSALFVSLGFTEKCLALNTAAESLPWWAVPEYRRFTGGRWLYDLQQSRYQWKTRSTARRKKSPPYGASAETLPTVVLLLPPPSKSILPKERNTAHRRNQHRHTALPWKHYRHT